MNILFALIPLGLMLLAVAVWGFFWAVRSGQFDDLETPPVSILLDDEDRPDDERRSVRGRERVDEGHGSARRRGGVR